MVALHWELRNHLHVLKNDGMLSILTALFLHADNTLRCWPSRATLAEETGIGESTISRAITKLKAMKAIITVPVDKRVGRQSRLSKRKNVYQLTGVMEVDNKAVKYLHLTPEGWENVVEQLDDLGYDLKAFDPDLVIARSFRAPKDSLKSSPLSDIIGPNQDLSDGGIGPNRDIEDIPVVEDEPIKEVSTPASGDTPETPKPKRFNALQESVALAWKIKPGGYAGKIGSQLMGTAKRGERKTHRIEPSMAPVEITGFGLWFRHQYPEADFPQKAETIANNVDRYRADLDYDDFVKRGQRQLDKKKAALDPKPITDSFEDDDDDIATPEEIEAAFAQLDALKESFREAVV
jgi:hypothetical protein